MKEKMSFEEAIASLEDIVTKLELGTLTLEESLLAYEQGIALSRFCTQRLEEAKQKVSVLTSSGDGVVSDAPFAVGGYDED